LTRVMFTRLSMGKISQLCKYSQQLVLCMAKRQLNVFKWSVF